MKPTHRTPRRLNPNSTPQLIVAEQRLGRIFTVEIPKRDFETWKLKRAQLDNGQLSDEDFYFHLQEMIDRFIHFPHSELDTIRWAPAPNPTITIPK